ncbi:60S ribosomal protein L15-2, putative [Entamoeba invadens IP1]|uniref:Ribosomal protein L15 n=2 Tax=Entamoeba invadens TaxID=33085 RepID=A0A0A1UCD9_ENTIV|nr:60S ribosomal protein L15-2, putative [Entamoeba invadens IP1]ELP92917.1 60S ribosomal protein L15-2, putative [Entamoeba invadens IP1]BAN40545.1 60S ribosomal protein L15-2, putative [Entamoeba invadens]|eukprot:XP_004259688.1 60S ribosomal protein L15-2, putative [Entamoeba invadens IP1]
MGAYKYINALNRKKQSDALRYLRRIRCWELRHLPRIHRIAAPTNVARARILGFKNRKGFLVFSIRVHRGNRKIQARAGIVHRKPANQGIHRIKKHQSLQVIAENRVGRKYPSLRVLTSYSIGQDSTFRFYEIIMVDPMLKEIRDDPTINWICAGKQKRREARGLTHAGKVSRGLSGKGRRYNKVAHGGRRHNLKRRMLLQFRRYR